MGQNAGWTGMLEFIEETAFGVLPTAPAMEYIGVVQNASINDKPIIESTRYLPQQAYTTTLGQTRTSASLHQKVSSEISMDIEYLPKTIWSGLLPYALGEPTLGEAGVAATGAADALGGSLSVGGYALGTPKYLMYSGGYVTDFTLDIQKDAISKVSTTLEFANSGVNTGAASWANTANPMASDYKGTGEHAAVVAGDALTMTDVTSSILATDVTEPVTATDIPESISINISNNLRWIKDLDSSFTTKRSAAALLGRDITLGIELSYNDLDLYDEILAGTAFTYDMVYDGYTFHFGGFKFPEYPVNLDPEELLGETIESTSVTNFQITLPAAA